MFSSSVMKMMKGIGMFSIDLLLMVEIGLIMLMCRLELLVSIMVSLVKIICVFSV